MNGPPRSTGPRRSSPAVAETALRPVVLFAVTLLLPLLPLIPMGGTARSAESASQFARPLDAAGSAGPAEAQVAAVAVLGENLISNPGAEGGSISVTGFDVVAIPNWTRVGNVNVVRYATSAGLWPATSQAGPVSRGAAFFTGGPLALVDSLRQTVDLSALAATIDSGSVRFDLAAYLGGIGSATDRATVQARFLDASDALLGTATIGPVTASDRANVTGLLLRSASGALPTGARRAAVTLTFTGSSGLYSWGFADSLGLSLSRAAVAGVDWAGGTSGLYLAIAPNPAPGETFVGFTLPASGATRVEVLDVTGRRVALLADDARPAGRYELRWSARQSGAEPGMYFVRLATPSGTLVRKLVTLAR